MLIQNQILLSEEELNTIFCALRNVQYWHKDCIRENISKDSHVEQMKKNKILLKKIEEFWSERAEQNGV